jgi:renalase
MSTDIDILIIGAGMAGLTCARELARAGWQPLLIEKGRGLGGRLATRRGPDGMQFDHGAQFATAREPGFQKLMADMGLTGEAAQWFCANDEAHWVGAPRMNRLAHYLAQGLTIRTGETVQRIARSQSAWQVTTDQGQYRCRYLVVTAPAPQAIQLMGEDHPLSATLSRIDYAPCHALMLGLAYPATTPPDRFTPEQGPFGLVVRDSSKPGRPETPCWVAHTTPEWSRAHLEEEQTVVAERLLPFLCQTLGVEVDSVTYCQAHRWRYARVTRALSQPFLSDDSGTLFIGGDGCLGPRVEAAWQSGTAIAEHLCALGGSGLPRG